MATLGVVEAVIFLIIAYHKSFDLQKEAVFADVHFLLFFSAIINSAQSLLLAILSRQVTNKLWVRMEDMELASYIVIREDFENVHAQYRELTSSRQSSSVMAADRSFDFNWQSVLDLCKSAYWLMREPNLMRRHHHLLMQVRFHELRVHFLNANSLPSNMRVATYLRKSELFVLQRLTKVSMGGWLLFAGAVNSMYFILGIVGHINSETIQYTGEVMAYTFFCANILFVLGAIVLFFKMRQVFSKIMR